MERQQFESAIWGNQMGTSSNPTSCTKKIKLIKLIMDKHPILQKLEDYLNSTSKEQLEKDWEELKQYQNIGPTMD